MILYDAHCHLSFSKDPLRLVEGLESLGVRAVSATVTPSEYREAFRFFEPFEHVRVGLGFHPWWVADGRLSEEDLQDFEALASSGLRFVSEVGLDFAPKRLEASVSAGLARNSEEAKQVQVEAFQRVMTACGDRVSYVSLHSVKAEREVLGVLQQSGVLQHAACVFHGFGGPQDQLLRALDMGCYVSVGPRMLSTKRGRAYVKSIPLEKMLLETDAPSREGSSVEPRSIRAMLEEVFGAIAEIKVFGPSSHERLADALEETSARVLGFSSEA